MTRYFKVESLTPEKEEILAMVDELEEVPPPSAGDAEVFIAKQFGRWRAYDYVDVVRIVQAALAAAPTPDSKVAPEAFGSVVLDSEGFSDYFSPRRRKFFGAVMEDDGYIHDRDDIARLDRDYAGCAPHRQAFVYLHPSPAANGTAEDLAEAWWKAYADATGDDVWRLKFGMLSPMARTAWRALSTEKKESS